MDRILKTAEISTEVIRLIQESREYCYLVTPYFRPWPLLERVLGEAQARRQRITLIVRSDQKSYQLRALESLQSHLHFQLIALAHLHMKLYVSEKAAIVSSMNLYDSSQERNYEVGYLFANGRIAKSFLHDVIDAELLLAPAATNLKGWFSEEEEQEHAQFTSLMAGLAGRGYCVTCGHKCDLDLAKSPQVIRCRSCWGKAPNVDYSTLRISHCHYCGEALRSVGSAPLHEPCILEVKAMLGSRYYSRERRAARS